MQTTKNFFTSTAWRQGGARAKRAAITLLVMVLTATGAWAQTGNWVDYRANGLSESDDHDTIYISKAEELALFAYNVNQDLKNAKGYYCARTVELQADIDLGAHYWTPIGTGEGIYFDGRFNGNGHVITGMNVNTDCSTDVFGFIGCFHAYSFSHIDNIIFKDCHVSGSIITNNVTFGGVGIVVGYYFAEEAGSSVTNCLVLDSSVDEINIGSRPKHGAIVGNAVNSFSVSNNYYYNMTGNYGGGMSRFNGGLGDVEGARRAYAVTLPEYFAANASTGISYGGKFYTKDGTTVTLSHDRPGYTLLSYTSSQNVTITDGTFTMPAADVTIDAIWANPDDISISDDGMAYTIKTTAGWELFCNLLESGETFSDKTVYLGASIEVSRMAGDGAHGFAGTFDGQNNTLTFNYGTPESPADEQFVALFHSTPSGTSPVFRNLTIDGSIYATHTAATDHDHAGGLIGHLFGTVTIDKCVSNVRITTTNEDGAGGFVGLCEHSVKFTNCKSSAVVTSDGGNNSGYVGWSRSSDWTIRFEGCVFNGKLLMKDDKGGYNGGFVGWKGDAKTVYIDNCLYVPADTVSGETLANSGSATFCRQHDNKLPADISNSYYTQAFGSVQGKAALSVTAGENVTVEAVSPVGDSTNTYNLSGIAAYAQGVTCDGTFYYGSGDEVSLKLLSYAPEGYVFAGYTISPKGVTLNGDANPYTLTMPDSIVIIGAKFVIPMTTIPYIDENGEEKVCIDYTIITDDMESIGIADEETWYVVDSDVTINRPLLAKGDIHLILADGASLTVNALGSSDDAIYCHYGDGSCNLTIYGQSKGNGKLTANGSYDGIYFENGSLTINGGEFYFTAEYYGIYIKNGYLTINGGKVDSKSQSIAGDGLCVANGTITLGWTQPDDHICTNSYSGTVNIASGQFLTDGTNIFTGNDIKNNAIKDKILFGVDILDNSSANDMATLSGKKTNVYLSGLTLDDSWTTLCLPFDVNDFDGTSFEGLAVKEIDTENGNDGQKTGFKNGTLYLNFKDAESIKAGKPYIVKGNAMTDASELNYTATDGSKGYDLYGFVYANLVDGSTTSSWFTTANDKNSDGVWFFEFNVDHAINVTGYTLTTADYSLSNPTVWTLKAKQNPDDEWSTIDSRNVNENNDDTLPQKNYTSKSYQIASEKQGDYQYFRFEVSETSNSNLSMAEVALLGSFSSSKNIVFKGVTINSKDPEDVASADGAVTFKGTYSPVSFSANDKSKLFLGTENQLYFPNDEMSIDAFHAYFQLADGLMNLNLGDVNGDKSITVSDVMAMVNHVLGDSNENFLHQNADINHDGQISVSDVMELVNWLINGSQNKFNVVVNTDDETNIGFHD